MGPLYELLKDGQDFVWSADCEKAFCLAKEELKSKRVLVHFDPKKEIVLSVDASPYGLEAVLSHRMKDGSERPIAYDSRTLCFKWPLSYHIRIDNLFSELNMGNIMCITWIHYLQTSITVKVGRFVWINFVSMIIS